MKRIERARLLKEATEHYKKHGPKLMKRDERAKRAAVEKHTYSGRTLRTEERDGGKRYRYLHATKGWRERSHGTPGIKPHYEGMLAWLFRRSVMLGRAS